MTSIPAARVGDGIAHTATLGRDLGSMAGFAIGLAINVSPWGRAATVLAKVAGIDLPGLGASLGQSVGNYFAGGASRTGEIAEGADTVFIELREAAKAHPDGKVKDCHAGKWVRTGCLTVFYETAPASRQGDETTCAGLIMEGSETVFLGPGTTDERGTPVTSFLDERTDTAVSLALDAYDILGGGPTARTAVNALLYGVEKLGPESAAEAARDARTFLDLASSKSGAALGAKLGAQAVEDALGGTMDKGTPH